jgi:rhodanese-related sulfurtransferase
MRYDGTRGLLFWILIGAAGAGCGGADKSRTLDTGSAQDTMQGGDAGITSDRDGDPLPPWPENKYISIDALFERVRRGDPEMLLINVSDEEFYDMGHIERSLKIPWDLIDSRINEIDAGKHIVLYCRRGVRSESAYDTLKARGYTLVWVMAGGLEQWIAGGYPVVPE